MKQLSVTGGMGFVGRHLLSACSSNGDVALRLLTRDSSALECLQSQGVKICQGDLLKPESLEGFLLPGSTVIHLAYLRQGGSANVEAARNLARAAVRTGVKRLVHCSSAVVVGFSARGVITEATPATPRGEYQQTKHLIEEILRRELTPRVELAILRPTEIIGAGGEGLRQMINRLVEGPRYANTIRRVLLRSRRFNYVSVDNVVAALMLLAWSPAIRSGEIYHISDDDDPDNNYGAVEEIVNVALDEGRGRSAPRIALPPLLLSMLFRLLPDAAPPDRIYSSTKIRSLGYEKVTSLRSTILEVIAHETGGHRAVAASSRPTLSN